MKNLINTPKTILKLSFENVSAVARFTNETDIKYYKIHEQN